jgi:hypothetical protein
MLGGSIGLALVILVCHFITWRCIGPFNRFNARGNVHYVKVNGEAASADTNVVELYPEVLSRIIEEDGYMAQQIFNID